MRASNTGHDDRPRTHHARRSASIITVGVAQLREVPALRSDVPDGASFQIGTHKGGVLHLHWSGTFFRDDNMLVAEADHTWTRKYWYEPLGLEQ